MMALETCHASVALSIEGVKLALISLSISSHHVENVTACATEAQRLLSVCQLALFLWENLLILPVNTSTEIFIIFLK